MDRQVLNGALMLTMLLLKIIWEAIDHCQKFINNYMSSNELEPHAVS